MANIEYNLDDNKFLKNRLSFHAASKVGISVGQALAQATNPDGHTVTYEQVWTASNDQFPKNTGSNKTTSDGIAATNDLVSAFKNGNEYAVEYVLTKDTKFEENKKYYKLVNYILTKDVKFEENKKYYKLVEGSYVEDTEIVAGEDIVGVYYEYVKRAYVEDTEVVAGEDIVGVYYEDIDASLAGKIFRNDDYPAVELYEAVEMSSVEYSDDQAWEVLVNKERAMDWISPVSVKDAGKPVPGFTGIIEANTANGGVNDWIIIQKSANASTDNPDLTYGWQLAKGTWEFVYMSGMLIFDPSYIPSKMSYAKLRITAFKYIGEKLDASIKELKSNIEDIQGIDIEGLKEIDVEALKDLDVSKVTKDISDLTKQHTSDISAVSSSISTLTTQHNTDFANTIAIKPYIFSLDAMAKEPVYITATGVFQEGVDYYVNNKGVYEKTSVTAGEVITEGYYKVETYNYSILIPGFVFQILNRAEDVSISMGDIDHTAEGSLIVFENIREDYFTIKEFEAYAFVTKGADSNIPWLGSETITSSSSAN